MKGNVAIIGLGYVGLPLSMAITKAGYHVLGVDYNAAWVNTLNGGISNIGDVPSEILKTAVDKGEFEASTEYLTVAKADIVVICVPTPLNEAKEPDLSYIIAAVDGLLPYIKKGVLISLESTTYPGTTDELIVNRIEKEKAWRVGEDFFVCYSPERVDPGNEKYGVQNTPKVIGGATKMCLTKGYDFYSSFLPKVVAVSTTRAAEMTKLLENSFRCINIAFINEMAMMCERMNIDIWEVIKGASSKPFGFMPFYPGPGVGGHCIPLDPLYLSWQAKKYNYFNRFIETASDINNNMPYYVISQVQKIFCQQGKVLKGSKILLLGMSYKSDIADLRESPALLIYEELIKIGAVVSFYDPYIESFQSEAGRVERTLLTEQILSTFDLIIITANHKKLDYDWIVKNSVLIYDTRDVCHDLSDKKIFRLGQNIEG